MEKDEFAFDDLTEEELGQENEESESQPEEKEIKEVRKPKREHKARQESHSEREVKHETHKTESEPTDDAGVWQDAGLWRFVGIALLVLLVVSIFTNGFQFGTTAVKGKLTLDAAAAQAIGYINTNLLQPGVSVTLQSKEDVGDLYKLKLSVAGQQIESYITKDARLLFPQGLALSAAAKAPAGQQDAQPTPGAQPAQRVDVSVDDDAVRGSSSAPVTIIEFSDYQCPFCRVFWKDTLPQLEDKYIKTGKVKFIYRDFPLSFHAGALPAALATECAKEQGKFWEMHDKIFEEQDKQGQGTIQFTSDDLKKWAKDIGLDIAKFSPCLDTQKHKSEVDKDLADGSAAGVSGTPGFFVNGQELSGAQPFAAFAAVIEAELAKGGANTTKPAAANEVNAAPVVVAPVAEAQPAAAEEKTLTITAKKYRFDPAELSVKKGTKVTLKVKSTDVDFGFALPAYNVQLSLKLGETVQAEFIADKAGTFPYTCTNCEGKESIMKGTLVVE